MKEPLFEHLRKGRAGCPSDLALDRLIANELPAEQATRTREHAATCAACGEHLRLSRFEALPEVNAAVLLSRIRTRAAQPRVRWQRLREWLYRPGSERGTVLALVGAACVVALLVVGVRPPAGPPNGPQAGIRAKGGPLLHVHRLTKTGSQEVESGDPLAPGERIRFVVDLPQKGVVSILGIEQSGALYAAWPTEKRATAYPLTAGRGQILPGAVALDDSPGRETLYLILCPDRDPPHRCQSRGAKEPPRCQEGCILSPFVLNKIVGPGP